MKKIFCCIILLFICISLFSNDVINNDIENLQFGNYVEKNDKVKFLKSKYKNDEILDSYKNLIKDKYDKLDFTNKDDLLGYHLYYAYIGYFATIEDLDFIEKYFVKDENGDLFKSFILCKINYKYKDNFNNIIKYLNSKPLTNFNAWSAMLLGLLGDKNAIIYLKNAQSLLIKSEEPDNRSIALISISLIKYLNGDLRTVNDIWKEVYGEGY